MPSSSSPPLSAVRASDANTHAHALQGLQRPPAPNPARTPQREVPDGLQDSGLSSAMAAPTPMMHGQRSYTAAGQQGGHGEGARPYEVVAKGWNQALEQISSQDEVLPVFPPPNLSNAPAYLRSTFFSSANFALTRKSIYLYLSRFATVVMPEGRSGTVLWCVATGVASFVHQDSPPCYSRLPPSSSPGGGFRQTAPPVGHGP